MTRTELTDGVAKATGLSKSKAEASVIAVFELIDNALARGEKVTLKGFGVFKVRDRKAREGRNPRTGETVLVEAKRSVKFLASRDLKESVNVRAMK